MSWVTPKTTWTSAPGQAFNNDPDYLRIKGNIEYLYDLGTELYTTFGITEMEEITEGTIYYPKSEFFNNIVNNINAIKNNTFNSDGYSYMRSYVGNGAIWNYEELNVIENNILILYYILQYQKNILPKLSFKLGGDGF